MYYVFGSFNYIVLNMKTFSFQLWTALEEDEFARKNKLTYKLEQVRMAMEKEVYI